MRKSITVSELSRVVKELLEGDARLSWVSVVGEVSGLKVYSRHVYFTLKDKDASLRCAWFGKGGKKLPFKDGDEVIASGRITVYPPRGEYSLSVSEVVQKGVGKLAAEFEKLKAKLKAEGLFDAERKVPVPALPNRLAIITSREAAALQDMLSVHNRNAPHVEIRLFPSLVQGADAPRQLISALQRAQSGKSGFDAVILARGGGSIEDLWCFNDESLARAIADSNLPTISGVGHESDVTICDLVADIRAPTPTAAMEVATGGWPEVLEMLDGLKLRAPDWAVRQYSRMLREFSYTADMKVVRAILGRIETGERFLDQSTSVAINAAGSIEGISDEHRVLSKELPRSIVSALSSFDGRLEALADVQVVRTILGRIETGEHFVDLFTSVALDTTASIKSLQETTKGLLAHTKVRALLGTLGNMCDKHRTLSAAVPRSLISALSSFDRSMEALKGRISASDLSGQLRRGFSVVKRSPDGTIVTSPADVRKGDEIGVCAHGGEYRAVVDESKGSQE